MWMGVGLALPNLGRLGDEELSEKMLRKEMMTVIRQMIEAIIMMSRREEEGRMPVKAMLPK